MCKSVLNTEPKLFAFHAVFQYYLFQARMKSQVAATNPGFLRSRLVLTLAFLKCFYERWFK